MLLFAIIFFMRCEPDQAHAIVSSHTWYRSERLIDLNGDGKPDTVRMQASGTSSDSLSISLTFIVCQQKVWIEHWDSKYELVDPPTFENSKAAQDAYVKSALQKALESVRVESFSESNYVSFAKELDSTLVQHPPKFQVTFSYGYGTSVALYWDGIRKVLRLLWICC